MCYSVLGKKIWSADIVGEGKVFDNRPRLGRISDYTIECRICIRPLLCSGPAELNFKPAGFFFELKSLMASGFGKMTDARFEVFFSGTVQGVGFRYTARQVARSFDVLGTVQNLPDGRVKMVVEGEPDTIDQFIREVSESTYGRVAETEVCRRPITGEFSGFHVIR